MPVLRTAYPLAHTKSPNHPDCVVVLGLGAGSGRALPKSAQGLLPPIAQIHSDDAIEFFLDRFRVPNCIITDNGMQFTRKKLL